MESAAFIGVLRLKVFIMDHQAMSKALKSAHLDPKPFTPIRPVLESAITPGVYLELVGITRRSL